MILRTLAPGAVALCLLISTGADAGCVEPSPGRGIDAESAVEAYVTALDRYADCVRVESRSLPPLQQVAAWQAYRKAFVAMQQAIDAYNVSLPGAKSSG